MQNKTISLPEELIQRLKQEDNASNLIAQLLLKHYEYTNLETPEEINIKMQKIREEKRKAIEQLDVKENYLISKKEIVQKEIESIAQDKKVAEIVLKEQRQHVKDLFKDYMQREITEEEEDEYFERLNSNDPGDFNIFIFLEEKGYKFPEEESA